MINVLIRTTASLVAVILPAACAGVGPDPVPSLPDAASIDARAEALMAEHDVPGLALAVIDEGEIVHMTAYGQRSLDPALPLETDTVMYGASLTKFVFANFIMQLVEEGRLDLDTPMADYFPKPLPEYEEWADLEDQPQWRELTLRHVLTHSTGWANFRFFPPEGGFDRDAKLKFYYDPGERYGYSGEAFILAQRILEEVFGMDVSEAMNEALFNPLGMDRTSMIWREDFRDDANFARGYSVEGENLGHNMQDNARAAGSMDTTLEDMAAFMTGWFAGDVVSEASREAITDRQFPITSDHQFPPLVRGSNPQRNRDANLSAGLGAIVWDGPFGRGFMKGGHNEKTDNMLFCLDAQERCVILLMNTAKGDLVFPELIDFILADPGFPWPWAYGSLDEKN